MSWSLKPPRYARITCSSASITEGGSLAYICANNCGTDVTATTVVGGACAGGADATVQRAEVLRAPFITSGVGAFTTNTTSPTPRRSHAGVFYNRRLYVLGGYDTAGDLADVREPGSLAPRAPTRLPGAAPRARGC